MTREPESHGLSRRDFYRLVAWSAGITTATGGAVYSYARWWESGALVTTRREIEIPDLPPAFDGFKIVHLSDLHLDTLNSPAVENDLVQRVAAEKPDLIALTGDYSTHWPNGASEQLQNLISRLGDSCPKIASLGNHDYWGGNPQEVQQSLKRGGAIVLSDDLFELTREGATLAVAALDELWQSPHEALPVLPHWRPKLEEVLARTSPRSTTVLLCHEPDFADVAAEDGRIALQLSGHTHGGQVAPPLMRPPQLPPLGRRYPSGWYQVKEMQLYTNRGVGLIPPLVRLNCTPEAASLTLRPRRERV